MSSINAHYTFEYSQPEAYRFSHDSVFLARQVFERIRDQDFTNWEILDLCSGCGIVGLDLMFHLQRERGGLPKRVDFLEVQAEYKVHFERNASQFPGLHTRLLLQNYDNLIMAATPNQYDLVVCNPPYFRTDQGKLSPSAFKNRCRFFIDSDFATLLQAISNSLKPGGQAFVLMRELNAHGRDTLGEAKHALGPRVGMDMVGEIRGTSVIRLARSPELLPAQNGQSAQRNSPSEKPDT